jgi:hypothetical protein
LVLGLEEVGHGGHEGEEELLGGLELDLVRHDRGGVPLVLGRGAIIILLILVFRVAPMRDLPSAEPQVGLTSG